MRKKLTILFLIVILILSGCEVSDIDPTEETPHAISGSSIRSGEGHGFQWKLKGSTLVITGEGKLNDWFRDDWNDLVHEIDSLELDPRITSIGDHVFSHLFELKGEIPLHEGLISVGCDAFAGYGIQLSSLPSSLTYIGDHAFSGCILPETFVIPETVTYIGEGAFLENNAMKSLIIEGTPEIGSNAFQGSRSLETVTLPEELDQLCDRMFFECFKLKQINLPQGIKEIPGGCFFRCTALESISLPDSLQSIDDMAFQGCSSLTEIQLPDTLLEIGNSAFENCTKLTQVHIPAAVGTIGSYPFYDCTALESITVSEYNRNYCSDSQGALYTKNMRRIIQPAPGKKGVFTIPDTVSHLLTWTFKGTLYSEIVVPDSVTTIDWQVFADCENLETISLPDSVTYLAHENFINCTALKSVRLPAGATTIHHSIFENCTSLEALYLPESLDSIRSGVFDGCTALKTIYYEGTKSQWNEINIFQHRNEILNNIKIQFEIPYP